MSLLPLALVPGVNKSETEYSQRGTYVDADKVRFFNGLAEKIGGWEKLLGSQVAGIGRGIHPWRDNNQNKRFALGTNTKLYVYYAGDLTDITPIRDSGSLTNPFTTTSGSAVVSVADNTHGLIDGDSVHFSGASAVGGITIDGEYTVTVTDGDNYTITHSTTASSSASGGGSVSYEYEINIGLEDSIDAYGYGVGGYGEGTYGTARATSITLVARTWQLDNRGDTLQALHRNGNLYEWDPDTGGRATLNANAPTNNSGMFVTDTRQIVMLGADGDRLKIAFCDQDDTTAWTAAITNTAGERNVQEGNELLAGVRMRNLNNLVLGDTAAYRMQHTGDDYVFDVLKIGDECGLVGPNAAVSYLDRVYWMSDNDFYVADGSVAEALSSEAIRDYVFGDINLLQKAKFWAWRIPGKSEIWFFYCSSGSSEIDRYVIYSVAGRHWTTGTLARTTGFATGLFENPVAVGADRYVYDHETGTDDDGSAMNAFVKSAPLDIADGEYIMDVSGILPDFKSLVGDLTFTLYSRENPNAAEVTEAIETITSTSGMLDPRASGQMIAFEMRSNEVGGHFRLGMVRIEAVRAGRRRPS